MSKKNYEAIGRYVEAKGVIKVSREYAIDIAGRIGNAMRVVGIGDFRDVSENLVQKIKYDLDALLFNVAEINEQKKTCQELVALEPYLQELEKSDH